MRQEKRPTGLGYIFPPPTASFPHLLTLTQKEKKLNSKVMITYKRPVTIEIKLTHYKGLV